MKEQSRCDQLRQQLIHSIEKKNNDQIKSSLLDFEDFLKSANGKYLDEIPFMEFAKEKLNAKEGNVL